MKTSSKQYAQALYEAIENQTPAKTKAIIKAWLELLRANRDLNRLEQILNEFASIWQKAEGIVDAKLISKHKPDPQLLQKLTDYLKELTGAKKINWQQEQDNKLLGGVIIKCQDQVIDASLNSLLTRFKNNLVN